MRLTIVHDSNGNIASVVAYPADAPPAYPRTTAGLRVLEIDAPANITSGLDPQSMHSRLIDLMQNYRIDAASAHGQLRRKP